MIRQKPRDQWEGLPKETLIELVQRRCREEVDGELPADVAAAIAKSTNPYGTLVRLLAYASLSGAEVTMELLTQVWDQSDAVH